MKAFFSFFILTLFSLSVFAQDQSKKPLDHSVYDDWKKLNGQAISYDGKWVSYEVNPQDGDGKLHLKAPTENKEKVFPRGYKASFSPNSNFLVFKFKPGKDTVRTLKLADKKKDELPKDSLGIYVFEGEKLSTIPRVKSYRTAKEKSNWMAYLLLEEKKKKEKKEKSKEEEEKDPEQENDSAATEEEEPEKGNELVIYNPLTEASHHFFNVSEYGISKNGKRIGFIREYGDSIDSVSVNLFNTQSQRHLVILEDTGKAKNISLDEKGEQAAFIFSRDTLENHIFNLYYWDEGEAKAKMIADSNHYFMPDRWCLSEHGKIHFSADGSKLYFGTAPVPEQPKEDSLLDEEKARVDVWNWQDNYLQPQQLKQADKEKKRSYKAVYHTKKGKFAQLGTKTVREVKLVNKGNAAYALGIAEKHYGKYISWEVPGYKDLYIIDVSTGQKTLAKKKQQYASRFSPGGRYLMLYNARDSLWHSYDVKTKQTVAVTKLIDYPLYEEEEDLPAESWAYGIMGWMENDEYVLVYDRYDIWKVDPSGKEKPLNLTGGFGRENNIRFSYQKLDKEKEFFTEDDILYLKGFDEDDKRSGYFSLSPDKPGEPEKLIMDDYSFIGLDKARHADKVIWRKMSFKEYPDLWYSDLSFNLPVKVSETNPQISEYKWGSVEMVNWTSSNGDELSGLLYLPEDFDSTKKYPMISYFYERYSDRMHRHYSPAPSASVINFPLYVSNDYVLFMPDIVYKEGHPGKSAYDAIMSGTQYIVNKGFVDEERVGIQGQSWGGYQVAYLVTQTDYFAAGMSGAPVSNMTSAYGGIRWGSGMSRMMQYEEGQSRIGGTLWEKPLLYIENSPIFHVENVSTPLLIMHNDGDGAVPWYQGIEMFVALRRLQKPVWMLNYNDDEHNLMRRANRKDLSVRMMQFFDHYLKGKPEPSWMAKGVPAVKKGWVKGYELIEKKEKKENFKGSE